MKLKYITASFITLLSTTITHSMVYEWHPYEWKGLKSTRDLGAGADVALYGDENSILGQLAEPEFKLHMPLIMGYQEAGQNAGPEWANHWFITSRPPQTIQNEKEWAWYNFAKDRNGQNNKRLLQALNFAILLKRVLLIDKAEEQILDKEQKEGTEILLSETLKSVLDTLEDNRSLWGGNSKKDNAVIRNLRVHLTTPLQVIDKETGEIKDEENEEATMTKAEFDKIYASVLRRRS